jgi:tetratricopeptide (TPR) repeat protein
MLYPEVPPNVTRDTPFRVTERLAMLPPKSTSPGIYELSAVYVNRRTGQTQPLTTPTVILRIDPQATATPAPELDLSTQLRVLAGTLPQGVRSLEKISNEISRINQYDPIQDYLKQTEQAMTYRLQQEPQNRYYAYTLGLAVVLQRQVGEAIAAFERVAQLDAKNPYAHAYLAFVNLYDFRPQAAQQALDVAIKLNPTIPEVQALRGVAALMQVNPFGAWSALQAYQKATQQRG